MSSPPTDVIDWTEAMQQTGDDEEFLRELLADLRQETDTQVANIEQIIQVGTIFRPQLLVWSSDCFANDKSFHLFPLSISFCATESDGCTLSKDTASCSRDQRSVCQPHVRSTSLRFYGTRTNGPGCPRRK